jgi:transposase-like protein
MPNGQQLLGRFQGGTFKEQLTAATITLTQGKCSFRGCPYPAEESAIVCGYHRQFFSYEINLCDRSIEDHYRSMEDKFTADGLVIQHRRKSQQSKEDRMIGLYHQILGSAGMLTDVLRHIHDASASQVIEWSQNHFAAQELFEYSRYPGKRVVCPYCGRLESRRFQSGFVLIYRCRLCDREWSLTSRTILVYRILTLDKWVHAICILKDNQGRGAIQELTDKLRISRSSAANMNHKLRLCGETLGLEIGWPGRGSEQLSQLRQKLGTSMLAAEGAVRPAPARATMTANEVASHFGCSVNSVDYWVRAGKLKCTRFRSLRLFAREDILAFKPPPVRTQGPLVSAGPSRRMIQELRGKGFSKADLIQVLGAVWFPGGCVRVSTETKVRAVYEHLIKAAPGRWVPAAGTWKMIEELRARGFTLAELTRKFGCKSKIHFGRNRVLASTEQKVKKVYERLVKSAPTR